MIPSPLVVSDAPLTLDALETTILTWPRMSEDTVSLRSFRAIYDHLDPRYKTRLGMLPTAWPVFRRVLISEGYAAAVADALLWEWEEHHCRDSRSFHLRPGGEESERARRSAISRSLRSGGGIGESSQQGMGHTPTPRSSLERREGHAPHPRAAPDGRAAATPARFTLGVVAAP